MFCKCIAIAIITTANIVGDGRFSLSDERLYLYLEYSIYIYIYISSVYLYNIRCLAYLYNTTGLSQNIA